MPAMIDQRELTEAFRDAGIRYFSGPEFMASMGSLDELPAGLLTNAIEVLIVADKIRTYCGEPLILSSGWRSIEVNRRVGGSPGSSHIVAGAVDLRVNRPTFRPTANLKLRRAAALAWIGLPNVVAGIGLYFGNIHIDVLSTGKLRRFWTSTKTPTGTARARLNWFAELRGEITQPQALDELERGAI